MHWRGIAFVTLALLILPAHAAATPAEPGGAAAPTHYRVVLPAANATERSALVQQGFAVDGLSGENAISIMTAAELAAVRQAGWQPLAVTPLDFPPADAAYHNYAELTAALAELAAAHPDIVQVSAIGSSLEGRPIPAVKISDHPQSNESNEPGVLFIALHHAREHLTVEMALGIIDLFTSAYGSDPALTNLVDQRELWVLPIINPDGGEYDIAAGQYRYWRKNRRANADGSYGVDLNRNYGYRWACCNGASFDPANELYQGPTAFSEPETQAIRDFVIAHPDITTAISFHTYGELILYPYGYTYESLPADMDGEDYRTFSALAHQMALTNGYTPQQASDLYITSGDTVDWLYGDRGIFGFTFEMYPTTWSPGFYPPGELIPRETERNFPAVIYLTGMADNPRKSIGLGGDATAPTVSLTARVQPDGKTVALSAETADDTGVTLVAWQVDGVTVALDRSAPFAALWSPGSAGQYDVMVKAFDAGANVGIATGSVVVGDGPLHSFHLPLLITSR